MVGHFGAGTSSSAEAKRMKPRGINRTVPRPQVFSVLALVSLVLASGCGSASSSESPPAVGKAFAARATAVCERALGSKQRWSAFPVQNFDPADPDPTALPRVAVWLDGQVTPVLTAWLVGLRGLGQPSTGAKPWSEVLAAVAMIVQSNADQIVAARAGDAARFAAATNTGRSTNVELKQATAAAGVPKCADVHS